MTRPIRWLIALIPLVFLGIFFVYPVSAIILRGLRPNGHWDLDILSLILTDPKLRGIAWFTFWQASVSTAVTTIVGLPGAFIFARYRFAAKRVLWAALVVPFVMPTIVVGSAFLGLIGPTGVLQVDLHGTFWAVLAAHTFFNYAVVVRTVGGMWSQIDPTTTEAARTLGASPWQAFRNVTLPLLRPAIMAAASIVFLFTFTSFGVILVLGGPAQRTLEVEIYRQTARMLNLDIAALLAIVQFAMVVAILAVYSRLQGRQSFTRVAIPPERVERPVRNSVERAFLAVNLIFMALLLGAPLAVLLGRSLRTPSGWGFDNYRALATSSRSSTLLVPPIEAIRNSLVFATAATLIAVVIGSLAAAAITGGHQYGDRELRRGKITDRTMRWLDTALMLPLGTSAVTVGFGFLIALDRPPLDFRGSVWLIPVAHALVAIPFVIRMMVPVLNSIDPKLHDAAAILGASPARVWREVDFPIVRRALLAAAGFAFAISLGEFGATVFLARADHPTLPVAIYRFLTRPGPSNMGQALALSTILMLLTVAIMVAIDRIRPVRSQEF